MQEIVTWNLNVKKLLILMWNITSISRKRMQIVVSILLVANKEPIFYLFLEFI